jgi:hypothetical protein
MALEKDAIIYQHLGVLPNVTMKLYLIIMQLLVYVCIYTYIYIYVCVCVCVWVDLFVRNMYNFILINEVLYF